MPDNAYFGGNYHDPLVTSRSRTQGWLLSDTLGFFNDKVLFTAAARHQKVVVRNYSNATGLEDTSSRYTQSRWMPTFGLVYKPWSSCRCMLTIPKRCSRALWRRRRRPMPGRVPIAHSKQDEVGVKIDYGTIGGSLALFEIKNRTPFPIPLAITASTASSVTAA